MSRWAEAFAALSRGVDTSDTSRQIAREPAQCHDVSTVSYPRPSGREALEAPATEAVDCNLRDNAPSWSEREEERAAIIEHDGKIPRAWAEGFARLDPDRPPADVPLRRWQRFVDDVGQFLDRWAAYAAALGWGPLDLFGCDRDRPFACIDRAGLLWLLNGNKLVALSENTATIERTGARETFRRKPDESGREPAWELAA